MTTDENMSSPKAAEQRLITIASGKGGVGKTWVSVSLAHALARSGKKILLFDGDLGLANVDIQLGIMPEKDLGMRITGQCSMSDIVTPYVEKSGSFDIVPGKSGSGALGSLSQDVLNNLKADLIQMTAHYDYVLLDLAAGVDASVATLSRHKGRVLVVMTGDPTSLTDAYAFIKLTHMSNPAAHIEIVVNNVPSRRDGERAYEALKRACEGFLKISPPLAAIIRQDSRVAESIRAQTPLLARHPQAEAAKDLEILSSHLIKSG